MRCTTNHVSFCHNRWGAFCHGARTRRLHNTHIPSNTATLRRLLLDSMEDTVAQVLVLGSNRSTVRRELWAEPARNSDLGGANYWGLNTGPHQGEGLGRGPNNIDNNMYISSCFSNGTRYIIILRVGILCNLLPIVSKCYIFRTLN